MTAPVRERVLLHPIEIELLCEFAETRAPFPLDIPATGTNRAQREAVFRVAREQLAVRGLAGSRGPLGVAASFVRVLRAGRAIDLVIADGGRDQGAVALVSGLRAVLATQSRDDPGQVVRLTELTVDEAVHEMQGLVPAVPAGGVPAFTLPLRPVRRVFDRLNRPGVGPLSDSDLDGLTLASGMDDRTVARLVASMRQVSGSGQAGAARWQPARGRWRRLGEEVRWVDSGRGRFRLSQAEDGDWASVNPFSRQDLRCALRDLGARVRDGHNDDVSGVVGHD